MFITVGTSAGWWRSEGGAKKSPDEDEGEAQTPVAGEWQFRV